MPAFKPSDDEQESATEKLIRKSKREPFIPIGVLGLCGAVLYGAYAYKNRGPAMTTSRYLMRLRVLAQSCVVGSIMIGVAITQMQGETSSEKP